MGFGGRWIKSCLSSTSISILVNGSPTQEFYPQRGIRQGDPLSPFLFMLAAEGLNEFTKVTIQRGLFKGISVGKDDIRISHLQYADDTILMGEWNKNNISNKCPSLDLPLALVARGELNVGSLKSKNWALIGKWWWRFCNETDSLWVRVIKSIYGRDGGLGFLGNASHLGRVSPWKNIVNIAKHMSSCNYIFIESFKLLIGNNSSFRFWEDSWLNGRCLKDVFSRLYMLEQEKSTLIKERVIWNGLRWSFT
ncbi:uncharacterized protein [Rutidosis leptorrhynchoides]|uniref:uncharacterized protein n=1 Tax=Rutidosis leptorrhynchoides TaxID=125765 RepID=UPI003A9A0BB4